MTQRCDKINIYFKNVTNLRIFIALASSMISKTKLVALQKT